MRRDLNGAAVGADGDEVAALGPGHRGDRVALGRQVAQPRHLTGGRRPQVHARAQTHAQHVLRRPVD